MRQILFFLMCMMPFGGVFCQQADDDYMKVLSDRAGKIVKTLDLSDREVYERVVKTVAEQYRSVGEINDYAAATKKEISESTKDKTEKEKLLEALENETKAKLYDLQAVFLGNLAADLSNDRIEKIKDGMTYGVLRVTYDSYLDMIPSLKPEEKRQIYAWLAEAREHAINASSSKDKHGWFGKYKGRINNYLSKQGYDIQKERKAWEERLKAQGKKL